jgi:threonine/homoserine/homoserine lactone efflux protein
MSGGSVAALLGILLVLAIVPGPSDVAVVARSLHAGFRQALYMVIGILAADYLFILLAVASLSLVAINTGPWLDWVKYACAAYLIWLGLASFRTRAVVGPGSTRAMGVSGFVAGFLLTLSDPKALLFYIGILPAFVDIATISSGDVLRFVAVVTLAVGGVKTTYAYLAHSAMRFFDDAAARTRLDRAAGLLLIGTGIFLLLYR